MFIFFFIFYWSKQLMAENAPSPYQDKDKDFPWTIKWSTSNHTVSHNILANYSLTLLPHDLVVWKFKVLSYPVYYYYIKETKSMLSCRSYFILFFLIFIDFAFSFFFSKLLFPCSQRGPITFAWTLWSCLDSSAIRLDNADACGTLTLCSLDTGRGNMMTLYNHRSHQQQCIKVIWTRERQVYILWGKVVYKSPLQSLEEVMLKAFSDGCSLTYAITSTKLVWWNMPMLKKGVEKVAAVNNNLGQYHILFMGAITSQTLIQVKYVSKPCIKSGI